MQALSCGEKCRYPTQIAHFSQPASPLVVLAHLARRSATAARPCLVVLYASPHTHDHRRFAQPLRSQPATRRSPRAIRRPRRRAPGPGHRQLQQALPDRVAFAGPSRPARLRARPSRRARPGPFTHPQPFHPGICPASAGTGRFLRLPARARLRIGRRAKGAAVERPGRRRSGRHGEQPAAALRRCILEQRLHVEYQDHRSVSG